MPVNKIVYGGNTLIDLSNDTVAPEGLLTGITAHDRSGAQITGTMVAGPTNVQYCEINITSAIGGSTGSHVIPVSQSVTQWLADHYNSSGITVNFTSAFQIMQQYSVMSSWATDHYVLGVTTYGLAAYNGTSQSTIGNVTIRSQSDSVKTDCRSNFAIRVNSDGVVSMWFNSAQYWIRPGRYILTAWCD